jgi:hypothetical protein
MPAACVLPQSRLPWWSTCGPGIPTPARLQACLRWRSASARPTCPPQGRHTLACRFGTGHAALTDLHGRCREGPAPRRHASAHPLCSPWGLARVSSPLQRRRGWPCRCRPFSVRRPLKPPSTACIETCQCPEGTIRRIPLDSVAWSAVVRVDARAAVAPCPPATILTAVGAVRMRYDSPSVSAARRARPPRRSWTHSCGRTSAVS